MRFFQRLKYYGIGLGIGLVVTFVFFGNRGCGWLPQNRVLEHIAQSAILRSDSVECILSCYKITDQDIYQTLSDGDVMFSESNTQSDPKLYIIEGKRKSDQSKFKLVFKYRERDTASVIDGVVGSEKCDCNGLSDENPNIMHMPENMVKGMFAHRSISITETGKCMMDCYKLNDQQLTEMVLNGEINYERSTPLSKPDPRYVVEKDGYELSVELAEKKTRITKVVLPGDTTCHCIK